MYIRTLLVTLVFGVVTLAGCASAKLTKAEYLSASFDTRAIANVAIAPVLDMRVDKSEALELDKEVHIMAKESMVERGYTVVTYADRSLISTLQAQVTRDAIESMVKDLVIPDGPRHVLLFGLIDGQSKLGFGSFGSAGMFGYLVDQERHEVLWSHSATGKSGALGFVGMAMKNMMTPVAIDYATRNLVFSIPPREKPR
jgi:hypothetical protein